MISATLITSLSSTSSTFDLTFESGYTQDYSNDCHLALHPHTNIHSAHKTSDAKKGGIVTPAILFFPYCNFETRALHYAVTVGM